MDGESKARVEQLLASGELRTVFHPVVDLAARHAIGFEALARFPDEGERPPSAWFADAVAAGMRSELELAAIETAVAAGKALPSDSFLAFNVSPRTAVDQDLSSVFAPVGLERVVLDITEEAAVDEVEELDSAIEDLRREGARIALDDTGAGFVSLRHVVGVRPDIIKIGLEICRGINHDVANQAVASALSAFARRMGVLAVAEGIETEAELEELVNLGVSVGQGFLFGWPQPAEHFAKLGVRL